MGSACGRYIDGKMLIVASLDGQGDAVKGLLEKRANVNTTDGKGWTPLHFASQNGHVDVIKMLLDEGAKVDATDKTAWTSLHIACQNGHVDAVRILLEKGANVNAAEGKKWVSLHIASQEGHVDVVQVLLEKGANVNAIKGYEGWTPLHMAAKGGHVKVVEALLAAGVSLFAITVNGRTPRDHAAAKKYTAIVDMLDQCAQDRPVAYFCAGDHAMAEKHATLAMWALTTHKSAYAYIGVCLHQRRKHEEAKAAFLLGLEKNPCDAECALGLATASLATHVADSKTADVELYLDSKQCVICKDSPSSAVCVPCGHAAGCYDCIVAAQKKDGCPICQRPIAAVFRMCND